MLDFQKRQRAFTQRIRHGSAVICPEGITQQRMQLYQDNFHAGIEETLASCFPILRTIIIPSLWQALVSDFYANYPSKTPLFYEIPQTFLSYLLKSPDKPFDRPFLTELAHYEWMELAISLMPDQPIRAITAITEVADTLLTTSELAEIVGYHFPVHQIRADFIPIFPKPFPTYLCIYRNHHDEVKYIELNTASARLLQRLKERPYSGREIMARIATETQCNSAKAFRKKNGYILIELLKAGIIFPVNEK